MNNPIRCIRTLLLMIAAALFLGAHPSLAVHDIDVFELDGNAVDDSGAPAPDDWATLYNGGLNNGGSATAFTGIIVDKNGTDDYFTGGGSKTPNLIGQWQYKLAPPSDPPDKNNITNAYAANYVDNGEQIIYFGVDLFADNGDAEVAFWFFQNEVAKGPIQGNTGGFTGTHADGDVYVAIKWANGGTTAEAAVYEWDFSCTKPPGNGPFPAGQCAADNLRVKIASTDVTCTGGLTNDLGCAITNQGGSESAPWPYTPKTGTSGTFPPTTFFEGGLNIFEVFGANKCFSSFMATTGASTSFTATAKDFALGSFDVCSVAASKVCTNDADDDFPDSITYNVRGCAINDGGGSINVTSLLNSIGGGATYTPSDLEWYTPGQVDDGGLRDFNAATDCDNGDLLQDAIDNGSGPLVDLSVIDLASGEALVYRFSETTANNGATDEVTIDAEGTDGSPIDAASDTATCPTLNFPTDLDITKQCGANLEDAGSNLVVRIDIQGQVCNTEDVIATSLVLTDAVEPGVDVTFVLDPNNVHTDPDTTLGSGECVQYSGYYYPNSIPSGDICPFMDQVTATWMVPVNSVPAGDANCTPVTGGFECSANSNSATCNLRATDGDNDCSTGPIAPVSP